MILRHLLFANSIFNFIITLSLNDSLPMLYDYSLNNDSILEINLTKVKKNSIVLTNFNGTD